MTNWVTWAYNWYVQRWPWAKVGVQTWGHNLRQGFIWDNDCFLDNQLAHPYHGSMYHNSARASGYGFWSSLPFVAAGSASWELFGENIQASLNDLVNTTIGGMALGEVTYRLSALLGTGSGANRTSLGGKLSAFVASPMATTHDLLDGGDQVDPSAAPSSTQAPARVAIGRVAGRPFLELAVQYGSPFGTNFARPYDAFEFRVRVSPASDTIVQHVGISGLLLRHRLSQSRSGQLFFGVFQHFDYDELPGIKSSGHSVSTALLYQRSLGEHNRLNLSAHAEGLLLGGISSDHGSYWRRDYDLGPGAGARLAASLSRDEREWLRLDGRLLWLHSIHGSDANHLTSFIRIGAALPVSRAVGAGGDLSLTTRHSQYRDYAAVNRRVPQFRAFLTWAP
ncbi:MAG TPA: DUF3943 domain-containing protein [Gemmatimonadales bacterium]|nr:DUF3943 domain-containing protein [Gemmatimonadales bacterium]